MKILEEATYLVLVLNQHPDGGHIPSHKAAVNGLTVSPQVTYQGAIPRRLQDAGNLMIPPLVLGSPMDDLYQAFRVFNPIEHAREKKPIHRWDQNRFHGCLLYE